MTKKELRIISLQFRTLSSQMLKVDSEEEIVYIQTFFDFISITPFLYDYISSCHTKDYDFDEIFKNLDYHERIALPASQIELIDFEYQLMQYILHGKRPLFYYGEHYTSSNKFADMISAFMRKVIEPFVVALRSYLEISLISMADNEQEEASTQINIFLSYCQKDSVFADLIDSELGEIIKSKAKITRDIRDVAYHESFGKFMRTIQDHDFVILLVSDHYLKSRNCMYEVLEAIKDSRFDRKILFIILRDEDKNLVESHCEESISANVYSINEQAQYILYWRKEEDKIQYQIDEIGDPVLAINQIKEKKIIQKIQLDLPEFLEFLRDSNGLTLETHISQGFSSMVSFMGLQDC